MNLLPSREAGYVGQRIPEATVRYTMDLVCAHGVHNLRRRPTKDGASCRDSLSDALPSLNDGGNPIFGCTMGISVGGFEQGFQFGMRTVLDGRIGSMRGKAHLDIPFSRRDPKSLWQMNTIVHPSTFYYRTIRDKKSSTWREGPKKPYITRFL